MTLTMVIINIHMFLHLNRSTAFEGWRWLLNRSTACEGRNVKGSKRRLLNLVGGAPSSTVLRLRSRPVSW